MTIPRLLAVVWLCLAVVEFEGSFALGDEPVEFRRDVLPILSENCFACHGFDEAARQASMRLDTLEGALSESDSGEPAIVPGKPDESPLIHRVEAADVDERMPPPDADLVLSEEHKRVLRRWIEQGAQYQQHWSFEKPRAGRATKSARRRASY